jgi:anthranilate synthase component 2
MGARHRTMMVEGVQYHPESILSPDGPQLLGNFLKQSGGTRESATVPAGSHDAAAA